MKHDEREEAILIRVQQELLAEGYNVVIHPNRLMVPTFLGQYNPDALAFGKGKNLVVEVISQNKRAKKKVDTLNSLINAQPDWDLKLIWISASETPRSLPVADNSALSLMMEEIEELIQDRRPRPAFLLLWAMLEALGRKLMPISTSKPQTPRTLVEKLAREGHITPEEASTLRDSSSKRNRLTHGDLNTDIRRKDVLDVLAIVKSIISRLNDTSTSSSM
jgi:uncharacterized protein YutE (UPF0331/DUF86 family)